MAASGGGAAPLAVWGQQRTPAAATAMLFLRNRFRRNRRAMMHLFGSILLTAFAVYMTWGYLNSSLDASDPATFVGLVLVVGFPLLGAALLARRHATVHRRRGERTIRLRQQTIESELLKLAAEKGGRLTAVELAMHLAITPEAATEALDRLALRGQADYEVTDAGVIVYSFHDIMHLGGKHTAKGVLDA
jgi:hypothetical protein